MLQFIGIVNHSVTELRQICADAVGWLTMDGTGIDCPFVQTTDNDTYLRTDINGEDSYFGTVFLDYRNQSHFSDFVTVLYGRSRRNGDVFRDLSLYEEASFPISERMRFATGK